MPETFIKIVLLQNLSYEQVKNPRYNIDCFDVMLSFSKLMRTIHVAMTSTFQCEYCQFLHSKDAINSN